MMRRIAIAMWVAACLVALPAAAQTAQSTDPIRELLTEVRALRQTIERAATAGTRLQVLVARVQLQEQRISDVARRLNDTRTQLRNLEMAASPMAAQLKATEARMGTVDPAEREAQESHIGMLRGHIEALERQRQETAAEEAFLTQQLATEQGRWTEFNERLEQLEGSLAPPEQQ